MATKVLVPLLGEGVEEVTVMKWLKKEGDSVNELEPLLEVNTDKVDTEIPAPISGIILKILAEEGVPAKVGAVLALIGKPGEPVDSDGGGDQRLPALEKEVVGASRLDTKPQPQEMSIPVPSNREMGFISPVVAKIAAEHGVNLQQVPGTGLNGRITKNDVLNFVERGQKTAAPSSQTAVNRPVPAVVSAAGDQLIKHTAIRKQIAEHMVLSKQTSPHVLTVMEADMSRVVKHRSAN